MRGPKRDFRPTGLALQQKRPRLLADAGELFRAVTHEVVGRGALEQLDQKVAGNVAAACGQDGSGCFHKRLTGFTFLGTGHVHDGHRFPLVCPLGRDSQISADTTRAARLSATAPNYNVALSTRTDRGRSAAERKKMAKSSNKTVTKKIATKPRTSATEGDDTAITAFALPPEPLSPEMAAYFEKCEEKLGFVPNVLKAYAFDNAKLSAFVAMYNDLMLAPSGLSKLEREMIAVAVSSYNRCYYCLVAHGAAVRALSGDPALGELMVMNYRAARLSPRERAMLDFAVKLSAEPWGVEEEDRAALRRAGFSDRDIWDIAAVAGFFNMSNRIASATDMRPNSVYHGQAR